MHNRISNNSSNKKNYSIDQIAQLNQLYSQKIKAFMKLAHDNQQYPQIYQELRDLHQLLLTHKKITSRDHSANQQDQYNKICKFIAENVIIDQNSNTITHNELEYFLSVLVEKKNQRDEYREKIENYFIAGQNNKYEQQINEKIVQMSEALEEVEHKNQQYKSKLQKLKEETRKAKNKHDKINQSILKKQIQLRALEK